MPDENTTVDALAGADAGATDEQSSLEDLVEERLAEVARYNQAQIDDLKRTVGRIQSLADRFATTPQGAPKQIRDEFASLNSLLADVVGSIDPSVLPDHMKQRVAAAKAAAERAANQAAIEEQINARLAQQTDTAAVKAATDTNMAQDVLISNLSLAVKAEIEGYGLSEDDPAYDWEHAATLLKTQGPDAMLRYVRAQTRSLLTGEEAPASPSLRRRPRSAPKAAGATANVDEINSFVNSRGNDADKIKQMRAQGIIP